MDTQKLKLKYNKLIDAGNLIRERCKREGRELTADEVVRMTNIADEIENLETLLTRSDGPMSRPGSSLRGNDGPFNSLGEQILAIREASRPGGVVDSRLHEVRAGTGANVSVPSEGGFLLQQTFSSELLQAAWDYGILAKRCRRVPITNGNSLKFPGLDETSRATGSRQGGVRGYWKDEGTEATASKPTFREVNLTLHKMICLGYMTEELIDDAPALEAYLREAFANEISFMTDDAILWGTGAGQPLGVMNADSTIKQARAGGGNNIDLADILNMWKQLIPAARRDAIWLINADAEPDLYKMSLTVGSGGSAVYIPSGGAAATPYSTLLGRPVIVSEHCETAGTSGDIILGNFRQGYLLADKGGLRTDMSIHVKFEYDEQVMKTVLRLDGQPMLGQAVTQYKSSDTMSHFVALQDA